MGGRARRALRRTWRGAWYAVAIGLVLMALGAGITSQLLPLVERHPDRVAGWLGERAGRTVSFDRLETAWTRRGPLLRLDGLRIGEGEAAIPIGAAEVLVAQYTGLLPGRSLTELRLRGLELTLERAADGRWQVRGLPGAAEPGADPFELLEGLGELQVIDGVLGVDAPDLGLRARLAQVDLRLRVDGDRVRAALRAWMVPGASPLDMSARLDRRSGDASAWLALRGADLGAWSELRAGGIGPEAGRGRLEAWAELRNHRVANVTVRGQLEGLRLARAVDGLAAERPAGLGVLDLDARWAATGDGWRFDARRLRLGGEDAPQVLDGLLVAGGSRRALVAERIDAGALLALAPLASQVSGELADWLVQARPDAVLENVEVAGDAQGRLRASARVEGLGFAPVDGAPGMRGLSGGLRGDAAGLVFTPDPGSTVAIDWPVAFGGAPHELRLQGEVAAWTDAEGWQVRTPALRIDGQGYAADARGGLVFQGDGSRPVIDLAVELDESRVPVARRFWMRHLMSEGTVQWLDSALLDGRVLEGRAVVSGDLDDWPFPRDGQGAGTGLFHASARIEDGLVRFDTDWPAAEALDARVDFVADGFRVVGRTAVGAVPVERVEASIAHFGEASLRVDARFAADAAPVLSLLRASPLREGREGILDGLAASGPMRATLGLVVPLGDDPAALRVDGRVSLAGTRLAEQRWELAFDDVHGEARYDRSGFSAEGLRVRHDGQPGRLSLRAGDGHVQGSDTAFEAAMEASLDSSQLARRAPQLAWLGERLRGRSDWTLALGLPADAGDDGAGGRLQLRSDLVGTRLSLPEPLGKPAAQPLAATIDLGLPLGEGDVDVVLGDRVALRARSRGDRTGVLVVLGSDRVDAPPPGSGIRITGRTPLLDATEWAGLFSGPAQGGPAGLALQGVDLLADRLRLLGAGFASTRVVARPERRGTRFEFEGEGLAGTVSVPRADGEAVSAHLRHLHWRGAGGTGLTADRAVATGPGRETGDALDPASIPPLAIVVEDLRLADARLGRMELRTRPTPEGLAIDTMQFRAPGQSIDVDGSWHGRGAKARTRLQVTVESRDFGALLAGAGLGQRMDGGNGSARFDGTWPGSPMDFSLGALEGGLALAVREGRLVEVEPGAGRFLGLLSVAELPRRLMLDFRDFFSRGFVFNEIGGGLRFDDGLARSDGLLIDGAAAEIRIGGSADLRAQTYDQVIEVFPRTGGLLTAVGALTAGPVGAAVGAVANAVFEKPLGRMGARTYHVTGPWKDPKVVVEGREPPPAARP